MELPLIEKLFDWIGKIVFPRQQEWERRRNAKIMTAAVTLGLALGWAVAAVIRHLYGVHR
jgi:hypothetical protein